MVSDNWYLPPTAYSPAAINILMPLTQCPRRAKIVDVMRMVALSIAKHVETLQKKMNIHKSKNK